MFICHAIHST